MTGTLLGAVLRGIRSRALLSAGSLLLIALAIGSAVLGPVFQVAVTNSYVVTRLNDAPPRSTGLSRELVPAPEFQGGPAEGVRVATEEVLARDKGPFAAPQTQLESVRVDSGITTPDLTKGRGLAMLLAKEGACDHLQITGRCPTSPGQALILAGDAEYSGLGIGDPVDLTGGLPNVTIVGTYTVPAAETDFWFDPRRLASVPRRIDDISGAVEPYQPAPLIVTPQAFDAVPADAWRVRVDRRLVVPPDWTEQELAAATASGRAVAGDPVQLENASLVGSPLGDLPALLAEARVQEQTARSSIAPAVLSLVLVALALLLRLLTAASELRLPELALASLRGVGERRLWALGLVEPLVLILVALPLGVLAGVGLSLGLTRAWLAPGLPLPLPTAALVGAVVVFLAAVGVAVLAVGMVLRDTLASQLAGLKRPGTARRTAVLMELTLVALAVGLLATKLTGGSPGTPDISDLVLPVVLAVVAGLVATRVIQMLARRASRRPGRSLPGFVAARALGRRQEGTLVILPVTAAIAVGVFGIGVYDAAADWRGSVAATAAPAAELWSSPLTMAQTVDLTHEVDPDGTSLMALASFASPGARLAVVDASRMASVLDWSDEWTPGTTVDEVQALIASSGQPPRFTGTSVGLAVDRDLVTDSNVNVEIQLRTAAGKLRNVYVGPIEQGTSTVTTKAGFCRTGCSVERMTVGGGAALRISMDGRFTIEDIVVDDQPLPGGIEGVGWALSEGVTGAANPLQDIEVTSTGGRIVADIDTTRADGQVRLVPGEIPAERPLVVGVGVHDQPGEASRADSLPISGANMPVRKVLSAESLPLVGPAGSLIDYRMLVSDRLVYDNTFTAYVAAAADTPASMRKELADRGLSVDKTLADERATLDQGAYALALRLYAVASILVLLMALAGLFVSTAVQLPARRRDAAALRVVGVPRRVVVSAVAREFAVVLGGAAIAGILAGALAQYVVLRTIRLGYIETLATPRLVPAVDIGQLVIIAVASAVVFGAFAFASAALTVRGARGATLRENAR